MRRKALVTGGAGFIGTNLVYRLLSESWGVTLYDNLSRVGVKNNLTWLKSTKYKSSLNIVIDDVRKRNVLEKLAGGVDVIFHLAAQVAVTKSIDNPIEDFEINAGGTLNVLEAARKAKHKPQVIYASTNKVYGPLSYLKYKKGKTRYECLAYPKGINERIRLDFYSPYACSKGAADCYVLDYKRVYGLDTVSFRQSCIYGPRQIGVVDQGWMAHLAATALKGKPITFYGDGRQVRDALFVSDLIDAFLMAVEKRESISGEVFNIGGGSKNSISLMEYVAKLEKILGKKIVVKKNKERVGDQKVFISDNSKAEKELEWKPKTKLDDGIESLVGWISDNIGLFR